MPISWSKDYSIGVEQLDNQHKKLIFLINRLEVLTMYDPIHTDFRNRLDNIMAELINYTILHFSTEEVLMDMFDYEDSVEHKRTHAHFIDMIKVEQEKLNLLIEQKDWVEVSKELEIILKYLQNWLLTHILKSDKKYTDFFIAIQKKAKKSGGWFAFLKN